MAKLEVRTRTEVAAEHECPPADCVLSRGGALEGIVFGRSGPHVIIPSITGIMPISDGRKASIVDLRPGHRMDADRTGQRRGHRAGRAITPIAGAAAGAAIVQALPDTAHPQAQVVGATAVGSLVPRHW
jgi:hypothetical protein